MERELTMAHEGCLAEVEGSQEVDQEDTDDWEAEYKEVAEELAALLME